MLYDRLFGYRNSGRFSILLHGVVVDVTSDLVVRLFFVVVERSEHRRAATGPARQDI